MGAIKCLPLSRLFMHRSHKRIPPRCVKSAFEQAAQGSDCLTPAHLASFLRIVQGDLSANESKAVEMLVQFSANSGYGEQLSSLDLETFLDFLLDPILNSAFQVCSKPTQDMMGPLSHYYIYTSHNTYLTGNQLTSKSSVVPIVEALQAGCRVIELDCWERKGEIMVLHGNTLTKAVRFEDCLKAIKENAFTVSEYPVIVTIENHLGLDLQEKAARVIKEILGDVLFLPAPEERPPKQFASPEELKGKIIISDTPPEDPVVEQVADDPKAIMDVIPHLPDWQDGSEDSESPPLSPDSLAYNAKKKMAMHVNKLVNAVVAQKETYQNDSCQQTKTEELNKLLYIFCQKPSQMKETPLNGEFVPGERAIMANISESELKQFIKKNPGSIIQYTRNNLGRMYPFGLRFDSSNADPFLAWTHGFQLAAVNMQGQDRNCWVTQALFDANGRCGYVKKPDVLLPRGDIEFEQIGTITPNFFLKVKILMGTDWHRSFDYLKKPDFYVKLVLHGMPFDHAKKRTEIIYSSLEPNWEHQSFEFPVRVPDISVLRLEVWEYDRTNRDDFVGQACFPVMEIKSGIRVVALRSRKGILSGERILCHFEVGSGN